MATIKPKPTARLKSGKRKSSVRNTRKSLSAPYDARKYAGTVPAFASVVAEEMKSWRDDR